MQVKQKNSRSNCSRGSKSISGNSSGCGTKRSSCGYCDSNSSESSSSGIKNIAVVVIIAVVVEAVVAVLVITVVKQQNNQ